MPEPRQRWRRRTSAAERFAFATAMAKTLLHHSAEALLQLFLLQRALQNCPWVEVAGPDELQGCSRNTCPIWRSVDRTGPRATDRHIFADVEGTPETFEKAKDALLHFIATLARHYPTSSNSYNAIKHEAPSRPVGAASPSASTPARTSSLDSSYGHGHDVDGPEIDGEDVAPPRASKRPS